MSPRRQAAVVGEFVERDVPSGIGQAWASGAGPGGTAFGRRLRELRLKIGLSQKQLAHSSTLSLRAIRDLENGRVRQPRVDTQRLLADALGLSAPQLHGPADGRASGPPTGKAEPAVSGPFLGREQELAALTAMLGVERHRLVTITGIEGVGKTRLALEVAHAVAAAEHARILWQPLDGARPRDGRPLDAGRLVEIIGDSNGLLVLDGARPQDELADSTADFLAACPRLRILVTTRSPVAMPHDTLCPLAPLPVPPSDLESADLEQVASVALLLAQTKRLRPAFRPDAALLADVARICRALDGLPAALESAAHWSLIYSLRQLADQLTTEPLTVARRPHGGQRPPDAFASVHDTIAALSRRQRDLLAAMSQQRSREPDGFWSVPQLADGLGVPAAECADDIYHLLVLGLLHRVDRHDVAMYKVLNIVTVIGSVGQPAAA